jgi:hypothetical protein
MSADGQPRQARAVAVAAQHLAQTVREHYLAGEPIIVYGHPDGRLGRHPEVLQAIWAAVDECSALWRTTLSELAAWWRARARVRLDVRAEGAGYVVAAQGLPAEYRVAIEVCRGARVAVLALDGPTVKFVIGELPYQTRQPAPRSTFYRVDPAHGWRARLRRQLDWERVTPPDEITPRSWRGLLKRALRQLKT